MAVFDYALASAAGPQRLSRARAKSALIRGDIGPTDKILVIRRDPPETRLLSTDQLKVHFDMIAEGIEDPFQHMEGEVVGSALAAAGAAAAPATPPAPQPPVTPEPPEPAVQEPAPQEPAAPPAPPVTPPQAPAAEKPVSAPASPAPEPVAAAEPEPAPVVPAPKPAAPEADRPPTLKSEPVTPAEPSPPKAPEPAVAAPVPPAVKQPAEPTPASPPVQTPPVAEAPRPANTVPADPVIAPVDKAPDPDARPVSPASGAIGDVGAPAAPYDPPAPDRGARATTGSNVLKPAVIAAAAAVALALCVGLAFLLFSGERTRSMYAGDTLSVRAEPAQTAALVGQIEATQPLTAVFGGGENPPPDGWARLIEPAEFAGSFIERVNLSSDPLPEAVATAYALIDLDVLASPDSAGVISGGIRAGDGVVAQFSGGETPPAPGWARIVSPVDLAGGFAAADYLSETPLPEVLDEQFAILDAAAYATPSDDEPPQYVFAGGERVSVLLAGGSDQPPAGWARLLGPAPAIGLFMKTSEMQADPTTASERRIYLRTDVQAVADPDDAGGAPVAAGMALDVLMGGGDTPPPPGWARILAPDVFAGLLVRRSALAAAPLPEQRLLAYGLEDFTAAGDAPLGVLPPKPPGTRAAAAVLRGVSDAGAGVDDDANGDTAPEPDTETEETTVLEPVDLGRGEALELIVGGGLTGPPSGWGLIETPERAAGRWVSLDAVSDTPVEARTITAYVVGRQRARAAPDLEAETVAQFTRGQTVTVLESGGGDPPPFGWVRLVNAGEATGSFMRREGVADEPLREIQSEVFTVSAVDFHDVPDPATATRGRLPRGAQLLVVRSGGENSPPDGWVRIVEPQFAEGGYVETSVISANARRPITSFIEAIWTAGRDTPVYIEPSTQSQRVSSLSTDQSVYAIGRLSGDWVEISRSRGRVGYAPANAFREAGAGIGVVTPAPTPGPTNEAPAPVSTNAPAGNETPINQIWWIQTPTDARTAPQATAEAVASLNVRDEVFAARTAGPDWIEISWDDGVAYVPSETVGSTRPPVILRPQLLRPPTSRDMQNNFPSRALTQGISGEVQLSCRVRLNGRGDCTVVSENPEGEGFGDAALRLAPRMRFQPELRDGVPTDNGIYETTIAFQAG